MMVCCVVGGVCEWCGVVRVCASHVVVVAAGEGWCSLVLFLNLFSGQ